MSASEKCCQEVGDGKRKNATRFSKVEDGRWEIEMRTSILYLSSSRCARPLPRGFAGHVAHPSRSIHQNSLPANRVAQKGGLS